MGPTMYGTGASLCGQRYTRENILDMILLWFGMNLTIE